MAVSSALKEAEALLRKLTEEETAILLRQIFSLRRRTDRGISKTPGVCGGRACIENTRMPVWSLVNYRLKGFSEMEILYKFPTITSEDLKKAWGYYQSNKAEIDRDIQENTMNYDSDGN